MDSKGNRQVCTNQTCSISITATVDAGRAQPTAEGKQVSLTRFSFAIILVLYSRVLLLQILHLSSLHLGKLQGPANWICRIWVPLWKKLCCWWWCHCWLPNTGLDGPLVWLRRAFSLLRRFCVFLRYKAALVTVVCYFHTMFLQTESCENTAV